MLPFGAGSFMVTFRCVPFAELQLQELYRLLQLRQEVFVVEQNCPYLDCDDRDPAALMVMGLDPSGQMVAHTRLLPVGVSYPDYASIGRVVTAPTARNQGLGRPLMEYSIAQLYQHWGPQPIKIGAQAYLKAFYESLGFVDQNEPYLEDGIPHLKMIRP